MQLFHKEAMKPLFWGFFHIST